MPIFDYFLSAPRFLPFRLERHLLAGLPVLWWLEQHGQECFHQAGAGRGVGEKGKEKGGGEKEKEKGGGEKGRSRGRKEERNKGGWRWGVEDLAGKV